MIIIVPGVSYRQNRDTSDHVFEGALSDLLKQIEALEYWVDDSPKYHVVTGVKLKEYPKAVYNRGGEQVAFLNPAKLIVKKDATFPDYYGSKMLEK